MLPVDIQLPDPVAILLSVPGHSVHLLLQVLDGRKFVLKVHTICVEHTAVLRRTQVFSSCSFWQDLYYHTTAKRPACATCQKYVVRDILGNASTDTQNLLHGPSRQSSATYFVCVT